MSSPRRLDPLLDRAKERQDKAARALSTKQSAHEQQQQRLSDLRQFRADYDNGLQAGAVINTAMLRNRAAFVDKVEQAVLAQVHAVERSRDSLEIERTRLLLASREKVVLEKLAASYLAEENKRALSRQQKELDELAGRKKPSAHTADLQEHY